MNITRGDIIVYSTPINEGSRRVFELMQEDYITLVFKSDKPIYFKVGDKVGDFEITDLVVPDFDEISNSYNYDIRFDKYYWKWKNKKFFHNPKIGAREASWALTANLPTHLNVVLRNLEHLGYTFNGKPFEFNIDNTVDNKSLLLRFDDLNIIDALTQIAEAYECEWWITDNIINFGRCEYGDVVDFEIGVNVEKMEREASQDTYATRIYAFGSSRNIPRDYRPAIDELLVNSIGEKRLSMPKGVDYIDAYEGMTQEEAIEEIVIFDDVYPSRDNTITEVRVVEGVREDKEKFYTYYIKDDSFIFDEKWVLGTDDNKLKLTFKSGLLNGHTYVLKYHQTTNEFEINRNEKDYGEELPNDRLYPKVGDVFNLTGYDTKYVDENLLPEAEKELERRARAYVEKSKIDPSVYRCSMMSDYMTNRTFEVGDRVRLLNKAFFEDGRESRIIGYEYPLDIPYDTPIYIVGETARYSTLGDLKDKVEELVYKDKIYQSTGAGVYVVGQYDNTEPTDRNVLSSKRSLNSFHRKDQTDETDYLQKYNKGAEFGNYAKKEGAYINEVGDADFQKVTSKDTDFKEMHSDSAIIDIATINELVATLAKIHNLKVGDTARILKTIVEETLSSEKFVSGFAGEGFRISQAINGDWNLEIDNLIVRKLFNVFEIVVQKISYQGGMIIRSACGGKITKVTDGGSYWRCEHDGIDDFVKDDQVLCQNFKVLTGDAEVKRYWRLATSAGKGYVNLSKTDMEVNSSIPQVGDEIVQLGNRTNINRQSAQIVSVVGSDAPYLDNYSGINSYSLKDKLVTREGNLNGIVDKDFGQLKGYGLYANNAYLKGILRLTNGKTVEQEILNTNNAVEANRLELGGQIDKAKADAKNANDKIDGLEIGGRNLWRIAWSKTRIGWGIDGGTQKFTITNDGLMKLEVGNKSYAWKFAKIYNNTKFSVSVDVLIPTDSKAIGANIRVGGVGLNPSTQINQKDKWVRIKNYAVFDSISINRHLTLSVEGAAGSYAFFKNIKVEIGNKVTDWTPAPEDYEAELDKQITSVRTDFDVIEGQINANVAKTEQLVNQTTGLVEETKQTATQVNQTATEINQNVSRAEESATRAETAETNINTKADSIVMEASRQSAEKAIEGLEIGGRNLFYSSREFKDLTGWRVLAGRKPEGTELLIVDNRVVYRYGVVNSYNILTKNQSYGSLKKGERYTVSMRARSTNNNTPEFAFGFSEDSSSNPILKPIFFELNEHMTEVHVAFVAERDWHEGIKFRISCPRETAGEIDIEWIKLERGNKPTDWSPAPEDYEAEFEATNSKLELLSDQFKVEVAKTDGTQKELTALTQDHDEFKVQVIKDIDGAIDTNNEVIKSEFVVNEKGLGFRGNEIDMTGKVAFTALNKESQTKINTANINANNALLDAGKAQLSADNANSSITSLKTNLGDLAYEDKVEKAKLGSTVIEGGFLNTDLLQAGSIKADKLDVSQIADNTMIGDSFVFVDGCFISQEGVDKDGNFSNNWKGFKNGSFIPNTVLRGKTGETISLKGKFGLFEIADDEIVSKMDNRDETVVFSNGKVPESAMFETSFDVIKTHVYEYSERVPIFQDEEALEDSYHHTADFTLSLKEEGEYGLHAVSSRPALIEDVYGNNIGERVSHKSYVTVKIRDRGTGSILYYEKNISIKDSYDGAEINFMVKKPAEVSVELEFRVDFETSERNFFAKMHSGVGYLMHSKAPQKTTFIGSDGLYTSFNSREFLHYKGGSGFTLRSGNFGLRVSPNGIQKWDGSRWIAANI